MKDEIEKNEKIDFRVLFLNFQLFLLESYILNVKAKSRHMETILFRLKNTKKEGYLNVNTNRKNQ